MKTPSATPQSQTDAIATGVQAIALNTEGKAPDWIELIPAGYEVKGRDGRAWINPDPQAVVIATAAQVQPLPLDYEHATEVRAPKGEEAPAAGWIEETEVREGGAIWGRVDWTLRGRAAVESREYRFVSPVFTHEKLTGVIRRLVTAALTNTPNLLLTALNRQGDEGTGELHREPTETPLTLATHLAAALGLAANSTDDVIIAAVTEARAANRGGPDLTNYAPRADLDAAMNRADAAEAQLAARNTADRDRDIEATLQGAMDAGKVIPASADTYRAMCREEGGLERFKALVPTLPVIAGAAESRAVNKVEQTDGSALTEEERAVCRALGQDEATFKSNQQKAV